MFYIIASLRKVGFKCVKMTPWVSIYPPVRKSQICT